MAMDFDNLTQSDYELVLGYIYSQALDKNDMDEIEAVETIIARRLPLSSYLHMLALRNVSERMTPQQWQTAIGDVVAGILGDPPAPPTEASEQ